MTRPIRRSDGAFTHDFRVVEVGRPVRTIATMDLNSQFLVLVFIGTAVIGVLILVLARRMLRSRG